MSGKPRTTRKDDSSKNLAAKIAVGAAVSVVLYFVLIAFYALAAFKTGLSSSLYMPIGIVLGALSGLVGGFVSVKPIMQKGIVFGALSGLISAIVSSAMMFAANGNKAGNGIFVFMAAMLLGGAAGGVAAMNLKLKKKY